MATDPIHKVTMTVWSAPGTCGVVLSTPGVPDMRIPMDAQVAFETGEKLARAAHMARFGEPAQTDQAYLADQIKRRTGEQHRRFLINRATVMLTSMREDKTISHAKLAKEIVEQLLNKVL